MTRRQGGQKNESGFTLVELLIAIAITAIVMAAVTQVVVIFFKSSDQTTARLIESRDMQVSSAYFANDVAAIGTRDYTDPANPVLKQSVQDGATNPTFYPCGSTGTSVVRLASDSATKTAVVATPAVITVTRVNYAAVATGSTYELHRQMCTGSSTPVTDTVIAHDLTAVPGVNCDVTCTGDGSAVPTTLTMTLVSKDALSRLGPVTVTLTGQRRQT